MIREIGCGIGEAWSRLQVPEVWAGETYRLHPALVDGALQSLSVLEADGSDLELPFVVDEVECAGVLPNRCYAYGRAEAGEGGIRRYEVKLLGERGEVLARLAGLTVRRFERSTGELLFYRPVWVPDPLREDPTLFDGPVLLLDDDIGLTKALQVRGIPTVQVLAGEVYQNARNLITIRRNQAEDYARLVQETSFAGVIHRWSRRDATLDEALELGPFSLHRLVQALLKAGKAVPLVYGYPAGEVAYEAVAGYAKSLRLEQPKFRLKTVEMEFTPVDLLAELSDERPQIRYLAGQRQMRTLEELSMIPAAEPTLRRGGVYVVTGGAGGLGRIFAEHLVQKYDTRLVLVGRSELSEARRHFLEGLGDRAIYVKADVSTTEGAERVVSESKRRYGAVTGVIHAAGELRDGLIWTKSLEDFATVLSPKVRGVEALDAATSREPLDCFILFSSTAGLLGNIGQSDYAYSNAYLDAFAHQREKLRSNGQRSGRTLSLNWPLWRDGGMQGTLEGTGRNALGILPLERAVGIQIFEQALAGSHVQVWGGVGDRAKIRVRLLQARVPVAAQSIAPAEYTDVDPEVPNGQVNQLQVVDYLVELFAELTKLPTAQIYADEPVENYGLDSIMITAFAQMLEHDLGELSKTLLFEYPTIESLAGYLMKNHAAPLSELLRSPVPTLPSEILPLARGDRFISPAATELPTASKSLEKLSVPPSEDIAIIGVFGRYPQADDLDEFWANLAAGRDCVDEVPADRWNYRDHYDPEAGKPGKTTNKWGGFLKDVDKLIRCSSTFRPPKRISWIRRSAFFLRQCGRLSKTPGTAKAPSTNARSAFLSE